MFVLLCRVLQSEYNGFFTKKENFLWVGATVQKILLVA